MNKYSSSHREWWEVKVKRVRSVSLVFTADSRAPSTTSVHTSLDCLSRPHPRSHLRFPHLTVRSSIGALAGSYNSSVLVQDHLVPRSLHVLPSNGVRPQIDGPNEVFPASPPRDLLLPCIFISKGSWLRHFSSLCCYLSFDPILLLAQLVRAIDLPTPTRTSRRTHTATHFARHPFYNS